MASVRRRGAVGARGRGGRGRSRRVGVGGVYIHLLACVRFVGAKEASVDADVSRRGQERAKASADIETQCS